MDHSSTQVWVISIILRSSENIEIGDDPHGWGEILSGVFRKKPSYGDINLALLRPNFSLADEVATATGQEREETHNEGFLEIRSGYAEFCKRMEELIAHAGSGDLDLDMGKTLMEGFDGTWYSVRLVCERIIEN